eukprot:CAMPEP_0194143860 /NCGR_PEP_ID=MMETSP0152-20130528/12968_1 /TAXON_ID=1049557 /ORGANISM="Thalassiothrix antarctica, Strain L6-D1" /LENGTH=176 /DNA_ID=CAMNT_0038843449 /DNA_START=411 /DNA_END=941 /DNA_ORIENTATION=+
MERTIITTLQWRLNPPTPILFLHYFLSFFSINGIIGAADTTNGEYKRILELAKQQIKLGIKDNLFIGSYASNLALAALANSIHAIKSTSNNGYYDSSLIQKLIWSIISQNDLHKEDIALYQDYLSTFLVKEPLTKNQVDCHSIPLLQPDKIMANTAGSDHDNDDRFFINGSPRNIF